MNKFDEPCEGYDGAEPDLNDIRLFSNSFGDLTSKTADVEERLRLLSELSNKNSIPPKRILSELSPITRWLDSCIDQLDAPENNVDIRENEYFKCDNSGFRSSSSEDDYDEELSDCHHSLFKAYLKRRKSKEKDYTVPTPSSPDILDFWNWKNKHFNNQNSGDTLEDWQEKLLATEKEQYAGSNLDLYNYYLLVKNKRKTVKTPPEINMTFQKLFNKYVMLREQKRINCQFPEPSNKDILDFFNWKKKIFKSTFNKNKSDCEKCSYLNNPYIIMPASVDLDKDKSSSEQLNNEFRNDDVVEEYSIGDFFASPTRRYCDDVSVQDLKKKCAEFAKLELTEKINMPAFNPTDLDLFEFYYLFFKNEYSSCNASPEENDVTPDLGIERHSEAFSYLKANAFKPRNRLPSLTDDDLEGLLEIHTSLSFCTLSDEGDSWNTLEEISPTNVSVQSDIEQFLCSDLDNTMSMDSETELYEVTRAPRKVQNALSFLDAEHRQDCGCAVSNSSSMWPECCYNGNKDYSYSDYDVESDNEVSKDV